MDSSFRLLVYAIAAVLFIWLFMGYIAPLFFPGHDPATEIGKMLEEAEMVLGRGKSNKLLFNGGSSFKGKSFDSPIRNVVFECNSASLCCPKGVSCNSAIEWDERTILFQETRSIETTVRCNEEYGISTCKVYFGNKPAQIGIKSIEVKEEFDLEKEKPIIGISVENSGSQEMLQGSIEVKVFQVVEIGHEPKEILLSALTKTEAIGALGAGKQKEKEIELAIEADGEYKLRVRASGLEAGSDEKIVSLKTTGSTSSCTASKCNSPALAAGKCIARCYCTGCVLGTDCVQKLKEAESNAVGLTTSVDLTDAENYILGSNIVEFVLPNSLC